MQVAGAGIEPTSGRSEGPVLPVRRPRISCAFWTIAKCERFGEKELNPHPLLQRQVAYHLADPRMNESAPRESNPPFQLGRLRAPTGTDAGWSICRSAKGTFKAAAAGIEPATGRLTVAFPYQQGTHRINKSGRLDLNQRSRAPEARGFPNFPTS